MFRHDARNVNRVYETDVHVAKRLPMSVRIMMRKDQKLCSASELVK